MPQVYSPLQNDMLRAMAKSGGWMTPVEIALGLKRSDARLSAADIGKLERLYQDGRIAKRISPMETSADVVVYEYRYLPAKRTRKEIIKNVLCEYYAGGAQTEAEVAAALGYPGERLNGTDRKHFYALVKDGVIAVEGKNGSAGHFRCVDPVVE
jgi:hypothetical protein